MEQFTTEIKPKDKLFNLDLREVWSKKYLLWLFIKRDILVQFKQTIFGLGWYFISPLVSTVIYIIIFSRVAGIPTDGIPFRPVSVELFFAVPYQGVGNICNQF